MRLTKAQVSAVCYELKREFASIGETETRVALRNAEAQFWKSPKGKTVLQLRKVWKDHHLMRYDVEQELKVVKKRFESPLGTHRDSEIEYAIQLKSITTEDITALKNEVRKHFYAKLKPAVRKRFGLKL